MLRVRVGVRFGVRVGGFRVRVGAKSQGWGLGLLSRVRFPRVRVLRVRAIVGGLGLKLGVRVGL